MIGLMSFVLIRIDMLINNHNRSRESTYKIGKNDKFEISQQKFENMVQFDCEKFINSLA